MAFVHMGPAIEFFDHDGNIRQAVLDQDGTFRLMDANGGYINNVVQLPIQFPDYSVGPTNGKNYFVQIMPDATIQITPAAGTVTGAEVYPIYPPRGAAGVLICSNFIYRSADYAPRFAHLWFDGFTISLNLSYDTVNYGTLKYGDAISKSSHNSYESSRNYGEQFRWNPGTPQIGGNRSFELDILQNGAGWVVSHNGNPGAETLESHLTRLQDQIAGFNPYHDVVTIFMEMKSYIHGDPYDFVDGCIRRTIEPGRIFAAGEFRGSAATLKQAVWDHNWPNLNDMRGKFVFVVGESAAAAFTNPPSYSETMSDDRACFGLTSWDTHSNDGNILFRNTNARNQGDRDSINAWTKDPTQLIRTYYIDDRYNDLRQAQRYSFIAVDDHGSAEKHDYHAGNKPYMPITQPG